jgi:hypothetical protein
MDDNQAKGKLAAALAAFQAEMPTVTKAHKAEVPTKSGGKYSYTYADLADVTEAAMPILAKHGLAFSCRPHATERGYELVGVLMHTSGETEEGALPIAGNSPQEMGSSLTYMRRYLLGCMTGLVTDDDDDGNLAQQAKKPRQQSRRAADKPAARKETGEAVTDAQLRKMHASFNDLGMSGDQREQRIAYVSKVIGREVESSKELTRAEASQVIEGIVADLEMNRGRAMDPPDDPWER